MTPVPEASRCSVTTSFTSSAPLQPNQIWPSSTHRGASGTKTVRRPDPSCVTTDAVLSCDERFPYVAGSPADVLRALGAERLTTSEVHAEVAAPSGAVPSQAAVLYTVLRYDRRGAELQTARRRLEQAVTRCDGGRSGHLGVDGLVGERESVMAVRSFQNGFFVFTATGDELVWLVIDGAGWSAASREQAARTALAAVSGQGAP